MKRYLLSMVIGLSLLKCALAVAQDVPKRALLPPSRYRWGNVRIVAGGFVDGIVFHPTSRDVAYLRSDMGGAYRWQPQQHAWKPITDGFGQSDWNLHGIESLALDPQDPNRVYIAAGTYTNDWAGNAAMLRSSDRGETWQRTEMPFKMGGNEDGRSAGERLAVDPKQGSVLFFGSRHNGLWRSANSGAAPIVARPGRRWNRFQLKGARMELALSGWFSTCLAVQPVRLLKLFTLEFSSLMGLRST